MFQLKALLAAGETGKPLPVPSGEPDDDAAGTWWDDSLVGELRTACKEITELAGESGAADEAEEEALPSDRSERTRTAEELVRVAVKAATEVPISESRLRHEREVAEERELANDIDAERLPGPLLQMSRSNYRLREDEEGESSDEEAEHDEEAVLDREALKKQARQLLKRQTKSKGVRAGKGASKGAGKRGGGGDD